MKSKTKISLAFASLATLALFTFLPLSTNLNLPKKSENESLNEAFLYQETSLKNDSKSDKKVSLYESKNSENVGEKIGFNSPNFSTQITAEDFSINSELNASFGLSNFSSQNSENANFGIKTFELAQLDRVPRRLAQGKIEYPESLLKRGIEGEVRALIFINTDGSAELSEIKFATNELFAESAKKLIPTLKFETPLVAGKPVRAKFILPIPFKIVK